MELNWEPLPPFPQSKTFGNKYEKRVLKQWLWLKPLQAKNLVVEAVAELWTGVFRLCSRGFASGIISEHPRAVAGMLLEWLCFPNSPCRGEVHQPLVLHRTLPALLWILLLPLAFLILCLQFPALSFSRRQEHPAPFRESLCNESFALIWAGFSQMLQSREAYTGLRSAMGTQPWFDNLGMVYLKFKT